ncbi:MAG TPA: hypothetical protein VF123_06395 [Candidatus Sulfotelmatobacter sp.]
MNFVRAAIPYLLQGLLGFIALVALIKDWKDYGEASGKYKHPVRIAVLVGTIAVVFLSMLDTYNTREEARNTEQEAGRREVESKKHTDDLTDQIRQEREENKQSRIDASKSFDSLYQRYSELLAKVQNADLLREIKQTRDELKATQEKLTQPKPRLTASFWVPDLGLNGSKKEMDVVKAKDGSVTFDITALNSGDTAALRGDIIVKLCALCKYGKEPDGSKHLPGSDEQDRAIPFEHILGHSYVPKVTVQAIPPKTYSGIEVAITFACENCVTETQKLILNFVPALRFPR